MGTRAPLGVGEWYHCYNRGIDKRKVFNSKKDYERFLLLLAICKRDNKVHISNFREKSFEDILLDPSLSEGGPLVEIGAYCLMPNHFHLVMKEVRDGGIARYMQKLSTGYTMYFNLKNDRTGALFAGTFKSKHVSDDRYFKRLISYIHCNPIELNEPQWKEGKGSVKVIRSFLEDYSYSSLKDYQRKKRPVSLIIDNSVFDLFDRQVNLEETLTEAQAYYQEINIKV